MVGGMDVMGVGWGLLGVVGAEEWRGGRSWMGENCLGSCEWGMEDGGGEEGFLRKGLGYLRGGLGIWRLGVKGSKWWLLGSGGVSWKCCEVALGAGCFLGRGSCGLGARDIQWEN